MKAGPSLGNGRAGPDLGNGTAHSSPVNGRDVSSLGNCRAVPSLGNCRAVHSLGSEVEALCCSPLARDRRAGRAGGRAACWYTWGLGSHT